MMKQITTFFKDLLMRFKFSRVFHPTRDGRRKAKAAYMATVRKELGTNAVGIPRFKFVAFAAVVAILLLNGGAVIYADTQDVSPESPLYAYKRVGEEIRLSIAPAEKKVEVQAEITERRSQELERIVVAKVLNQKTKSEKESHKEDATIKKLQDDIKKNVEKIDVSVKKLSKEKSSTKKAAACAHLKTLNESSLLSFDDSTSTQEISAQVKKLCVFSDDEKEAKKSDSKKDSEDRNENKREDNNKNKGKSNLILENKIEIRQE
jgi:hypothetical protein